VIKQDQLGRTQHLDEVGDRGGVGGRTGWKWGKKSRGEVEDQARETKRAEKQNGGCDQKGRDKSRVQGKSE